MRIISRGLAVSVLSMSCSLAAAPRQPPSPPPIVRITTGEPAAAPEAAPRVLITSDGKGIIFDGYLSSGAADRFRTILSAAPSVTRVILHSNGGHVGEAIEIATAVRARGLTTYVETHCISACTIILLAGKERVATPNAKIGFHEFVFPARSSKEISDLRSISRRLYDDAGVSPTFTDRVFSTASTDVWYPTTAELMAAHVLTRTSMGGEASLIPTLIRSKAEYEEQFAGLPFWTALKSKHPDIAAAFVAAGWKAKEEGGSDNDITNASRSVLSDSLGRIIDDATDDTMIAYLKLIIEEFSAARSVSYEACDAALKGQLNIKDALPPALGQREMSLMLEAINSPSQHRSKPKTLDDADNWPFLPVPSCRSAFGDGCRGRDIFKSCKM